MDTATTSLPPAFSLFAGGPLFRVLRRTGLSDDALHLLRRRIVCLVLVSWLPLLVLSSAQGQALPGNVAIPFLDDIETQARFLVVLPLLLSAELLAHQRVGVSIQQFTARGLVPPAAYAQFERAMASALRLRNSLGIELSLLVLVVLAGAWVASMRHGDLESTSWQGGAGSAASPAGMWLHYVAHPLFQFLVLRWYFRLLVWGRFLWNVSRIDLVLVPTHPDGAGGLGFLPLTITGYAALIVAHGVMLSARIAQLILYGDAALTDFKAEIALMTGLVMLVFVGPMLLFVPQLARAQRRGLTEYGLLAMHYVRTFDLKWLRGQAPAGEPLVGSADIQSLADLAGSYDVIRGMRIWLVSRHTIIALLVYTLAPVLPLLLTMMPLDELLKSLLGLLL